MRRFVTDLLTTVILVFGLVTASFAASPVTLLDSLSSQVIQQLSANQARLKTNPNLAYSIVDRIVRPHIDIYGMARSALGRQGKSTWKAASVAQRKNFANAFTKLVLTTYSSALAEYTNERVKFQPVRGGVDGKRFVKVHSEVIRTGAPNIPMDYRLRLVKGDWKIYDVSVEGVSLLRSYRQQFQQELQTKNLVQITATLRKKAQH